MHAQCALCIAHSVCVNLCVQQVNHLKLLSQPSPSGWDIEAVAPCPGSLRTPLTPTPPPTLPLPGKKAPWKFNWNLRVAIICRQLRERLIIPRGPPRFASPSIQPSNLHDHMIKNIARGATDPGTQAIESLPFGNRKFCQHIWSLIHCLQILVTKLGLQFWPPGGASCTDWKSYLGPIKQSVYWPFTSNAHANTKLYPHWHQQQIHVRFLRNQWSLYT